MARRLNVTEKAVRRMLDPGHRCRIDRLENALEQLGLELELTVLRSDVRFEAINEGVGAHLL
jgi:hypothetical protein